MTKAMLIAEANEIANRLSKILKEIGATEMVVTQRGWNRTYKVVGRPMETIGYEGEGGE